MKFSIKKSLKTVLPIALGIFLVWYWYDSTPEEARKQIFFYIREADLFWVGISVILGILGHVSRAIRWNYLLEPMGYRPRLLNNICIVLTSYLANLGIPRTGEILRATALTTYEGVPFEKGMGTIITERVVDVLMLLGIIIVTLILQTEAILGFLKESGIPYKHLIWLAVLGLVGLALLVVFVRRSKHGSAQKLRRFAKGLLDGLSSIFKMCNKLGFLFHTFLIWATYVGMFVVIKYTVPETVGLPFDQLLVGFVAGALAMMFTNGGVGLYPIAVSKALAIYGVSSISGDAFGWIMWISQTLMIVVFGAISFLVLPLWNRNR